jgi:hypothetical protein
MEQSQALVRFVAGWAEDGISEDGLPRYRETVRIIKSVPPLTEVQYEATEADFDENPGPYQAFQKEQAARGQQPEEAGFPLALWPVISPAQFKALVARGVNTIEQLAKLRSDLDTPGEFKGLIERAKQMLSLSANIGKFEAMLLDRDGQITALTEQVVEMRGTISAQNSLINTLKLKAA